MATISPRKARDGSMTYRAQIRIRRKGKIIYQEGRTFDKRRAAELWAKKREAYIAEVGAEQLVVASTIGEACGRYLDEVGKTRRGIGRSKRSALAFMQKQPLLADLPLVGFTSKDIHKWISWRSESTAPATIQGEVVYLRLVLEYMRSAWSLPVDLLPLEDAANLAKKHRLTGRSQARERRPTLDELDRLLAYFSRDLTGKGGYVRDHVTIPMVDIVLFLIFSTRRVSEVTRLEWDDLDVEGRRILVRDLKHPREKVGNHHWLVLPDRAMAIIEAQPRIDSRIFPFNSRSISTLFQRARDHKQVGIDDLRVHDLRHEGVSHLFELGYDIPRVALVSGHGSWDNLKRYTHISSAEAFDKYAGWSWLKRFAVD